MWKWGVCFLGMTCEQVDYILCFLTTSGFACSMYSVSLVLVFNHVFRPVLQLRTISKRFSFLSEWSSVSSLLDSDFWRGICYVIFLFRGPKYIFIITYFHLQIKVTSANGTSFNCLICVKLNYRSKCIFESMLCLIGVYPKKNTVLFGNFSHGRLGHCVCDLFRESRHGSLGHSVSWAGGCAS